MVDRLLAEIYGFDVISFERAIAGAGSDTYFALCRNGKYVVKFPSESDINDPEAEPMLCEYLLDKGISVCRFVKNRYGEYISRDETGRRFHVQEYIEGKMYEPNTFPEQLMSESAKMLGKIHNALSGYKRLNTGIGSDFFRYMTPENALRSYENTLHIAESSGDRDIIPDLLYRIELMKRFPEYSFDTDRLTCTNTHGDYFISQLICSENEINAVIDWTTACVHPAVWEIVRSYVYAAPECAAGEIDIHRMVKYFRDYLQYFHLNAYDMENAARLFFYQISVCDYYNQYYTSEAMNRDIYLHQALFSTRLMKWFEKHIDELTKAIKDI